MACFDLQASQPELYLIMTEMGMVAKMVIYIYRQISYGPMCEWMDGWMGGRTEEMIKEPCERLLEHDGIKC